MPFVHTKEPGTLVQENTDCEDIRALVSFQLVTSLSALRSHATLGDIQSLSLFLLTFPPGFTVIFEDLYLCTKSRGLATRLFPLLMVEFT